MGYDGVGREEDLDTIKGSDYNSPIDARSVVSATAVRRGNDEGQSIREACGAC